MSRPNPVRRETHWRAEVRPFCRFRGDCLYRAARGRWPAMTCEACEAYERVETIEVKAPADEVSARAVGRRALAEELKVR